MAQSKQNIFKIQLKPFRVLLFRPKSKRNIAKHLNFRISGQYISANNTSQIPGPDNE